MKTFPKKYNPQDLRNRAKLYRENSDNKEQNTIFSVNVLPTSKKLSYRDFFLYYLNDFYNCKNNLQSKLHIESDENTKSKFFESLFILSNNEIQNIASSYIFFNKKRQTLDQVWTNKLERHISATSRKNLNANNKILDSYFSSPHKILLNDSDYYLYLTDQIRSLNEKWKLSLQTNIGYRSFKLQTSIPFQHITRKKENTPIYTVKYFIWAKCEALPICAKDIDLCCWDVALLVHPKDKRYNKYIWKNAIIPLCNRQIPIIGDENVKIWVNNWIKRVCPCADQESISIAKQYWLPTDIYVFDKQWLYTEYIHEPAFIWQEREKYYNNIIWFVKDIWNLAEINEEIVEIPYLEQIDERLTPYKIDQIVVDLSEEKEIIINKILEKKLYFSFIDDEFWHFIDNIHDKEMEITQADEISENNQELNNDSNELKQKFTDEINQYLPDSFICNSQISYSWKIPLLKHTDWTLSFFDIESLSNSHKTNPLQHYFDLIILSLVRIWALWTKVFYAQNNESWLHKLCEYEKICSILSQNEKKIVYFIENLQEKHWEEQEFTMLIKMIQNLTDESNSTKSDCLKLVESSKILKKEWNWLILNIDQIPYEWFDVDFMQLILPCYIYSKWINVNNQNIYNKCNRKNIFSKVLLQQLLLWETLCDNYYEYDYNEENEFFWDRHISKIQIEQSQRDLFALYWENPIRLSFLTKQSYDHKEILLDSIFLKQIWNAIRFCLQNNFLPNSIEESLNNQPKEFDEFDLLLLSKLNELYDDWKNIEAYEQYIKFFNTFRVSIQDLFFTRYLEIQKTNPTKNIQFVCAYFFSFLLNVLYPLVPEYVDAACYLSKKHFTSGFIKVELNKPTDYNINVLYNTFISIKQARLKFNIKQHESCNIFIKSAPTLWEYFEKYEHIFKNFFHISDIVYLRLHEQNPLWYEIINDDIISIGIQTLNQKTSEKKSSIDSLEREIKYLWDKLNIIRDRIQLLQEWEQRTKAEEEYAQTKEELENLTIQYSLINNK